MPQRELQSDSIPEMVQNTSPDTLLSSGLVLILQARFACFLAYNCSIVINCSIVCAVTVTGAGRPLNRCDIITSLLIILKHMFMPSE
jgi:hypothetical protein